MIRPKLCLVFAACLLATPLWAAENKEVSCRHQGDVMSAIQKARLDRVPEKDVAGVIAASNPSWPESYNNAIPSLTSFVYGQKRRALRKTDLGADLYQSCVDNWDAIQNQQRKLKN